MVLNCYLSLTLNIRINQLINSFIHSFKLKAKCNQLIDLATSQDSILENILNYLSSLQTDMDDFLKQLYSEKRVAATHLMVFMITDEARNFKPYALPVRVLPYASMTHDRLRKLEKS